MWVFTRICKHCANLQQITTYLAGIYNNYNIECQSDIDIDQLPDTHLNINNCVGNIGAAIVAVEFVQMCLTTALQVTTSVIVFCASNQQL